MGSTRPRGGDDVPGPDNAAGWDRLADAYQAHVGWPDQALTWGFRCPPESDLQVLAGVTSGARTLVLGCGGGQDLVALARLDVGALVGIDPSARQLEHARARLDAAGLDAELVRARAEDLEAFDDASFDLVVSVQALNYVGDAARCFTEVRRVLEPGGTLAFSVMHPADALTSDSPPHGFERPWWDVASDWVWDDLAESDITFRSWFHSTAGWFTLVTGAGLVVDRIAEPPPVADRTWIDTGWLDERTYAKLDVVPGTIIVRAHRPTG